MLLNLRILTVLSLLVVFRQRSLRRNVEAQTTGQVSATTFHQLILSRSPPTPSYVPPPTTPSSSGGLPPGGISHTNGKTTSPPMYPKGEQPSGAAPPSGIQPAADGQTPWLGPPPFDGPPGELPRPGVLPPPLPPTDYQHPTPPAGGLPPPLPSTDYQLPDPPFGGLPPSLPSTDYQSPGPPAGGLPPPLPPPLPSSDYQSPRHSSGGLGPGVVPASLLPNEGQLPPPQSAGRPLGFVPLSLLATDRHFPVPPPTTDPVLTAPDPESFFISSLHWKCSPEDTPTDDQIGPKWDDYIRNWIRPISMTYNAFVRYSCKKRCGLDERDASTGRWYMHAESSRCYCDKLCDEFGDCCFDFSALCKKSVNPLGSPLSSNKTCLAQKNYKQGEKYQGYAVWNSCPKNWTESSVRQKCQHEDEDDLLNNLPVFDNDSHITYRNIFCARCNGAINTTYWKLKFDCYEWFNTSGFNLSNIMDHLHQRCSVTKSPKRFQLKYLKLCIPRFQDCFKISQETNDSYCQTECLRYAFPFCHNSVITNFMPRRFRNPQCALCNGFKVNELQTDCVIGSAPVSPSLTILFDFSSTSKHNTVVKDRSQNMQQSFEQIWSCAHDEVYDPYAAKCRKIVSVGPQNAYAQNENAAISKTEVHPNCTFVHFNESDYEQLTNSTVFIKPHNKIYYNTSYTVDNNGLLICVKFSRNATAIAKERNVRKTVKTTPASLHLLTTIGCIVSMASLVFLLITYILFPELRNLPGKIIINLSFSLLLYQIVLFSAVKTSNQEQCIIVAVLLHFFVLCSFTWMSVMAYDVHRVFTASDGVAASHHGGYNKRLIKYCLYAWGAPALVVSICVTIDQVVKKGSVGYGRGETECFISEPRALLYSFVLLVAVLMVFNVVALGHTVVHIGKTRKRTQQVTNQRHGTSIALICVKMASVMGVTWILGIAANFEALAFLWYPYVVLNSLQGLFIFLSFAASGKALELYRTKVPFLMCLKAGNGKKNGPSSNKTQEYTCPTYSEQRRGAAEDAHCETHV